MGGLIAVILVPEVLDTIFCAWEKNVNTMSTSYHQRPCIEPSVGYTSLNSYLTYSLLAFFVHGPGLLTCGTLQAVPAFPTGTMWQRV